MVKILASASLLLRISGSRTYAVAAAENVRVVQSPVAAVETVTEKPSSLAAEKKETYWMRDPDTGNWVPESHFGDKQIDAAELRDKLLPRHKFT